MSMIDIPRPLNWPTSGSYTTAISEATLEAMRRHVSASSLGGRSRIRAGAERLGHLGIDQWIGHLGELALSLYLTGSEDLYFKTRIEKDAEPWRGDGGSDLVGYPVDVKTSLWRYGYNRPRDHKLYVRHAEIHDGTYYVLALVQGASRGALVHLLGWAESGKVRAYYDDEREKSVIPSDWLRAMDSLQEELARVRRKESVA